MDKNWQDLAATSHLQTAVAIADSMDQGQVDHARAGLEELIDAMGRSEKRALRSQLIRLMVHVLKWKNQPDMRTPSWSASIYQAREEIAAIQEEVPSLTQAKMETLWDACLTSALRQARAEMGRKPMLDTLSWYEVLQQDFFLDDSSAS